MRAHRRYAAHVEMGGGKIKVAKIKMALDFADPKALIDFIKSSSKHKDPQIQQHLLQQALG
jgi:hypothetical protein